MFNPTNDKEALQRGFINKDDVLSVVSQEEIFSLVLGYIPTEHSFVCSPLRVDRKPGCWFEYSATGVLRLIDYADNSFADCFESVQRFYNLPSFYHTLRFIEDNIDLIKSNRKEDYKPVQIQAKPRTDTRIVVNTRHWLPKDLRYWSQFGITKEQLIEDNVEPVKTIYISSWRKDSIITEYSLSFVIGKFQNNRVKIYRPLNSRRFLTNCISDDIGMIESVDTKQDYIIISKSYKDCRVLRNADYNSVWIQSEVIKPSDRLIKTFFGKFKKVYVFFDNDDTGIKNSKLLADYIAELNKCETQAISLPPNVRVKDPAEMYHKQGKKTLLTFLKQTIK